MAQITVNLQHASCTVEVGPVAWRSALARLNAYERAVVITDTNVNRLYGDLFDLPKVVIEPGERGKTWANAERVLTKMAGLGLTRRSVVLALGGGVVGDLAGVCAGLFMRGIPYIQIPTTLLAQVDSAIGGKTAVDIGNLKNMAGLFHQPELVVVDPEFLKTLPRAEIRSGLGEVIKYGLIADPGLISLLQGRREEVFSAPHEALADIIPRCCAVKAQLVEADEFDHGARKQLNAGHTVGHALESAMGFSVLRHGEAVLLGLAAEARLACRLGLLSAEGLQEIEAACRLAGLPAVPAQSSMESLVEKLVHALIHDKKNKAGQISFMLPRALGRVEEVFLSPEEAAAHLREIMPEILSEIAPEVLRSERPVGGTLQELRKQIDACDAQLAEAFSRRLEAVDAVARYKQEHSLPIYDPEREAQILASYSGDVRRLFAAILGISRGRQSRTLFPYNIALIGFMGVGKSTVGPLLAHALGREFVDLDAEIERRWGSSIPQIFAECGEAEFRRRESELLQEVCCRSDLVIACGGGAVLREDNRRVLKATSRLVLLTAPVDVIVSRIGHAGGRPLLDGQPTKEAAARLLAEREPIYRSAADFIVDVASLTPQEVSEAIVAALLEGEKNQP